MFSKKKKFSPFFLNCGTEGERPPLLYCHIQAGIHQINTGTAISKGFLFLFYFIYIYIHTKILSLIMIYVWSFWIDLFFIYVYQKR